MEGTEEQEADAEKFEKHEVKEQHEEVGNWESDRSNSVGDNSDSDDSSDSDDFSSSESSADATFEALSTDAEIEELISEFLEVESKAAEAQESLEKESLARVEKEVRAELEQSLHGGALEEAVTTEMQVFVEQWEELLDELEAESALLLEQLDGAGIELPSLYKCIESQTPNTCCTEAWRKRVHWVGSQITGETSESIRNAETYLQSCRPVRRQYGRLVEVGASGYLERTFATEECKKDKTGSPQKDWNFFGQLLQSDNASLGCTFGSKNWASVYLANTPYQAANLGLNLPGVNEVEEIDDVGNNCNDPFYVDALAHENEMDLSEEQKKNFKKVNEEDDIKIAQMLQLRLKKRRYRNRQCQEFLHGSVKASCPAVDKVIFAVDENGSLDQDLKSEPFFVNDLSFQPNKGNMSPGDVSLPGLKPLHEKLENDDQKSQTIIVESDDQIDVLEETSINGGVTNFPCTACSNVLKACEVRRHPVLEVIICESCKRIVEEKLNQKDHDCSECYCGWCGGGELLINCKACKMLFCARCIQRNFKQGQHKELKISGWICCCCSPNVLHELIRKCDNALRLEGALSSSGTDFDISSSDNDVQVRSSMRKRRKHKIRRILEDAELGEETKQKIAIEKARQDHLKSLQGKSWHMNAANCNGHSTSSTSIEEILGDGMKGYIINVAREENEVVVRIPRSLSCRLKSHQVAGIRFMWENIIQSVRTITSGDKGLGCILAHTMGLGKTFQVIAFLYTAMRVVDLGLRTALIVTPVNVLHNWRQEFTKWKPSELKRLRIFMLEDVSRERRVELLAKWKAKGGVFLIGYTAFRNLSLGKHIKDRNIALEISHTLQSGPDILVCDEAHMIKNTRADITQALKQVKCQRRIALTGSPLQNNLMEYYCMVDFVREGFLGSSHEFRNRFQNPIENGQHKNSTANDVKIMNQRAHILYEQLKGFVQRIDMNVVKKDLPPKTVYVITVKLSPLQRKLYRQFLDVHGFANIISEKVIKKRCFFTGYQALAQIWNHPGLLQLAKEHQDNLRHEDAVENFLVDDSCSDDSMDTQYGEKPYHKNDMLQKKNDSVFFNEHVDWWKDLLEDKIYREVDCSGKMVLLLDILRMCADAGDKALVFSQSLTTLDLIELFLCKMSRGCGDGKCWKQGKDWYRLDGSTDGSKRQWLVERFNDPGNKRVKCTLISTKAGSLGINLQAANRVILVDGSWNPTNDLQAIYRVWRYGQAKPVYAYRLMAHGTMEEKIYKRQVTKEGLAARVVDRQQIHRTMSKEEVLHLFDFWDDDNPDFEQKVEHNKGREFDSLSQLKKESLPLSHGSSFDKFMETLISRHYPRWIANYHEHETLLQENEEEKLSKEEQDMAWEGFRHSLEWEEVQRVSFEDPAPMEKPATVMEPSVVENVRQSKNIARIRTMQRKCTNLAHLLTLRSQNTKPGSSTICGECAQEISWEWLQKSK